MDDLSQTAHMNELSRVAPAVIKPFCSANSVGVRPARMTQMETAALSEQHALLLDAAIADCYRIPCSHVTGLREANEPGYWQLRRAWLMDGEALLSRRQAQDARISVARHRRLREIETLRERSSFRFAAPCVIAPLSSLAQTSLSAADQQNPAGWGRNALCWGAALLVGGVFFGERIPGVHDFLTEMLKGVFG